VSDNRPYDDQSPTELPTERKPAAAVPTSEQLGPYRLLQRLGEGGMGEVWLAEQSEPVRRQVAIKVIKRGMDTKQVVARFEAERQALAVMDHPAVAKVFDAGETPRGRPFFVMEYVKGVPITEHCDRNKLTTRERLELFLQVCAGVQHAHQKAIIHRDLKPTNVLVAIQDDRPVPKIIDFGVAKATATRLTERTMFTELGVLIGTPEYMSPEQAGLTEQDIDTRTDVYSLGVILYELLVGALPFDPKKLRSSGYEGIVRTIRESEPSLPSARLSTLGDRSVESAQLRRTDSPSLQRLLKGDLDWITMKALEKDRIRRYGSPAELAADLERHLTDQPVLASPPSGMYRATKFVRRHRLAVVAGAAIALTLVAGAVVSTVLGLREAAQRRVAEQARADLETVADFQEKMLAGVDPQATGDSLVEALRSGVAETLRRNGAREAEIESALASLDGPVLNVNTTDVARRVLDANILRPAAEAIESEFADQPLIEARLRRTLSRTYRTLGLYDEAEPHARRALEIHRTALGEEDLETLESVTNLASTHWELGRFEEAEALYRQNLETLRRVVGEDDPDTLTMGYNVAGILVKQARPAEAQPIFEEVLRAQRRVLGHDHEDTLQSLNGLAAVHHLQGRYDEALPLYVEALQRRRRALGVEHRDTVASMNNLAALHDKLRRFDEAEALYREALETNREVRGESHPATLKNMNSLSTLYSKQGRFDEAESLVRYALEVRRRELGPVHPDTLRSMNNLGVMLIQSGRHDDARDVLTDLLALDLQVYPADHPEYGLHLHTFGELQMADGDLDGALDSFERVLPIYEARGSRYKDLLLYQLGVVSARRGEGAMAVDYLDRAVQAGYEASSLGDDPELETLRGDPAFEALLR
jgi:non-specific serine/threonine protein kinase/serine/threonine-protein kinase